MLNLVLTGREPLAGDDEVVHGVALPVGMSIAECTPQSCARTLTWNANKRRRIKEPDTRLVALRKQRYITAFPALVLGCHVPASAWNASYVTKSLPQCEPSMLFIEQDNTYADKIMSSSSPQHLWTDWERFSIMSSTVGARLSHGKSGIHGMGVFARLPAKAGDWVVEYQGQVLLLCQDCPSSCATAAFYNPRR